MPAFIKTKHYAHVILCKDYDDDPVKAMRDVKMDGGAITFLRRGKPTAYAEAWKRSKRQKQLASQSHQAGLT